MSAKDESEKPLESRTWERGWEDHARKQRARLATLTLPQKLAWLEEAHRVVRHLQLQRESSKSGSCDGSPNVAASGE